MIEANKTESQLDKEQDRKTQKQVYDIFLTELDGQRISTVRGPSDSILEFWQVQSKLVIVQKWPGAGWDYYIQSSQPMLENIAADIRSKLELD